MATSQHRQPPTGRLTGDLESLSIPTIARFVRGALQNHSQRRRTPSLQDLASIRAALLLCLQDCDDASTARLQAKIAQAHAPQELWLLRNDAYQLIARIHNQSIAAERINKLLPVFQGWIEPRQIVRIK